MTRFLLCIAVFVAALASEAGSAFAGDPQPQPQPQPQPDPAPDPAPTPQAPPTQEELSAAKVAFHEGNALFKAGKFAEAAEKLKESHRLSRNAYLLYNIGLTYDQLGQGDKVLLYYKQFLATAPQDAPMRPDVTTRVEALEKEIAESLPPVTDPKLPTEPLPPAVKLEHDPVFSAPPGIPYDVTVFVVPEDVNLVLTLMYRGAGEATFISKPMDRRGRELIARVPRGKLQGDWIQYYIEARNGEGKLVTRSGRSTSPHLVNIEDNAKPKFDPSLPDPDGPVVIPTQPLRRKVPNVGDEKPGRDYGAIVMTGAKWTTTGLAVGFLGLAAVTYKLAGDQHEGLVNDARSCGEPPCRPFDAAFGQTVQERGERYNTTYKVSLGIGVASAAVAGFLWFRSLTATKDSGDDVAISPTVGDGAAGAVVMGRF